MDSNPKKEFGLITSLCSLPQLPSVDCYRQTLYVTCSRIIFISYTELLAYDEKSAWKFYATMIC